MTTCTNKQQYLCEDECITCFDRSFASSHRVQFWIIHLNNNISPRNVFKGSKEKYWFNCGKHVFKCALSSITYDGAWCPYLCCGTKYGKLCSSENCIICYNASFMSSNKVQYWDYTLNDNISPRNVYKSSSKKYWFNCGSHKFEVTLANITNGQWCPYACCCKITSKLCDSNECKVCLDASFESSEKKNYWVIELNNGIVPRNIPKSTDRKFWFNCGNHLFQMRI
jgi:hypothetical protein